MFRDFYQQQHVSQSIKRIQVQPLSQSPREINIGVPFEHPRFGSLSQQQQQQQQQLARVNIEQAKGVSRYGNDRGFSTPLHGSHGQQNNNNAVNVPSFHSRDLVERRRNECVQQQQQQQQKQAMVMMRREGGDREGMLRGVYGAKAAFDDAITATATTVTNGNTNALMIGERATMNDDDDQTGTMLTMTPNAGGRRRTEAIEKLTQTDETGNCRRSGRIAGAPVEEEDMSRRITQAVEKTLESVAKEARKKMEDIAMRTQRDVLRCAADVARMQRDLSQFMGRYGMKRKNDDDDDDENMVMMRNAIVDVDENDQKLLNKERDYEFDVFDTNRSAKKKQKTPQKESLLATMISDSAKYTTDVVVAHIQDKATFTELRAAYPLLFDDKTSKAKDSKNDRWLRQKLAERFMGHVQERERLLEKTQTPLMSAEEAGLKKREPAIKAEDIFVTLSDPQSEDEEVVEKRVRMEIAAFQKKTKARRAARRGFPVRVTNIET